MKLNVKALSLTCGLIWGLGVLLVTWWVILIQGASNSVTWLGRIYLGFRLSFTGSLIGFIWALVDGLIVGAVFALLYNKLAGKSGE
jgi:hypothetical protein